MDWKAILAHVDVDAECSRRAIFALSLALYFDAELSFACVAEPASAADAGIATRSASDIVSAELKGIEELQAQARNKVREALACGTQFGWTSRIANPTDFIRDSVCGYDLALAFPAEPWRAFDERRMVDIGRFLLTAGRPVLVPAATMKPFKSDTILIAWKNTREARRAIMDAHPLLERAGDVVVLTVNEDDTDAATVDDVARLLVAHGVPARSLRERRPSLTVGATIFSVARSLDADVIVSGAYGHSRLRERLFGGVTRTLLEDNSFHRMFSN